MSDRLVRVVVAASLALSIGFAGVQSASVRAQVAPRQAAGNVLLYDPPVTGMTLPEAGKPLRFSMCEWRPLLADEVSRPCTKGNANAKLIYGGHNANFVFNTGRTFLPRGLTLDGNGILSGTTDVDLSKLVLNICVLQLNETASCQSVWFSTNVAAQAAPKGRSIGPLVGLLGGAVGGGLALGAAAKKYQEAQSGGSPSGGSGNSCTTSQPSSCTSSSKCSCGYRCVTFDGAGSVGFCSP